MSGCLHGCPLEKLSFNLTTALHNYSLLLHINYGKHSTSGGNLPNIFFKILDLMPLILSSHGGIFCKMYSFKLLTFKLNVFAFKKLLGHLEIFLRGCLHIKKVYSAQVLIKERTAITISLNISTLPQAVIFSKFVCNLGSLFLTVLILGAFFPSSL